MICPQKKSQTIICAVSDCIGILLQMPIFYFGCSQEQKSIKWDLWPNFLSDYDWAAVHFGNAGLKGFKNNSPVRVVLCLNINGVIESTGWKTQEGVSGDEL